MGERLYGATPQVRKMGPGAVSYVTLAVPPWRKKGRQ